MSGAKGAGIKNKAVRRTAYVGVLAALGFGLSWLELLLPSIGIPGAKPGVRKPGGSGGVIPLLAGRRAALVSLVADSPFVAAVRQPYGAYIQPSAAGL